MKITAFLMAILLSLLMPLSIRAESEMHDAVMEFAGDLPTEEIDDYGRTHADLRFRDFMVRFISGDFSGLLKGIKDKFTDTAFSEFAGQKRNLLELFSILLITALFGPLCGSLGSGMAGQSVAFCVQVLLLTLCADTYLFAASSMMETVDLMVGFMQTLLPVISGLFMAFGSVVAGGFVQPAVLLSAAAAATLIKNLVVPLLSGYVFLTALRGVSRDFPLNRLQLLLKSLINTLIGVTGSAFAGGLTVLGLSGSFVDGVAMKSMKFATRNFVPVVGGVFADSFEMLLSCGALVRNGLGVFGLVVLVSICAVPLLKLLVMNLGLRISAALSEPLAVPGVSSLLDGFADAVRLLLVVEAAVAMLFFAELSILMAMGSTLVAVR